jgi:hypothetical protein
LKLLNLPKLLFFSGDFWVIDSYDFAPIFKDAPIIPPVVEIKNTDTPSAPTPPLSPIIKNPTPIPDDFKTPPRTVTPPAAPPLRLSTPNITFNEIEKEIPSIPNTPQIHNNNNNMSASVNNSQLDSPLLPDVPNFEAPDFSGAVGIDRPPSQGEILVQQFEETFIETETPPASEGLSETHFLKLEKE